MGKMTAKQERFVAEYVVDFNAARAAVAAGYSKHTAKEIGSENLTKPNIAAAVAKHLKSLEKTTIATATERREFWTTTFRDTQADMGHRLRASELLGKSKGDFIERRELSGPDGDPIQFTIDLSGFNDNDLDTLERLAERARSIAQSGSDPTREGPPGSPEAALVPATGATDGSVLLPSG